MQATGHGVDFPPNFPPACSVVRTTSTAGLRSRRPGMGSTGIPRPSSTTRHAAVGEQLDEDLRAEAGERFVDRVVDHLVDEMVQAPGTGAPDVHAGALADRVEALEDRDVARFHNWPVSARLDTVLPPPGGPSSAARRSSKGTRSTGGDNLSIIPSEMLFRPEPSRPCRGFADHAREPLPTASRPTRIGASGDLIRQESHLRRPRGGRGPHRAGPVPSRRTGEHSRARRSPTTACHLPGQPADGHPSASLGLAYHCGQGPRQAPGDPRARPAGVYSVGNAALLRHPRRRRPGAPEPGRARS